MKKHVVCSTEVMQGEKELTLSVFESPIGTLCPSATGKARSPCVLQTVHNGKTFEDDDTESDPKCQPSPRAGCSCAQETRGASVELSSVWTILGVHKVTVTLVGCDLTDGVISECPCSE